MALSYGINPLTRSERSEISDFKRELVEGIKISDIEEAGKRYNKRKYSRISQSICSYQIFPQAH